MIDNDWIGEATLDLICSARKISQNQYLNGKKEPMMWRSGERVAHTENKSKCPEAGMSLLCLGTRYEEKFFHQTYQDQSVQFLESPSGNK